MGGLNRHVNSRPHDMKMVDTGKEKDDVLKMSTVDLMICKEVHAGLAARERNHISYLFLQPVDLKFVPDYLSVVAKPMDLTTLKSNLDRGLYKTKEEFYADAQLIWDNAMQYNTGRPENAFIIDLAKQMAKASDRLRKKAE